MSGWDKYEAGDEDDEMRMGWDDDENEGMGC